VRLEPLGVLGERAALAGVHRRGSTSCGGGTHLIQARDGWIAVTLTRTQDVETVPAWLEVDASTSDPRWLIAEVVANRDAAEIVRRGAELGLPVAAVGEARPYAGGLVEMHRLRTAPPPPRSPAGLVVVDLSALWAGPLAARILQWVGMRVIKVESVDRPDGARLGPPAFFDLLHSGQESVAVDLRTSNGRDDLRRLVAAADVVIEASRPRALAQLGVNSLDVLARQSGPRVWISITGYGRSGSDAIRVAFGDDAAAAGGLVVWDEGGPCFCADAIADPAAGMAAAAAALEAIGSGGTWLVDAALSRIAGSIAGDHRLNREIAGSADPSIPVAEPSSPASSGRGPRLGEHTDIVFARLARGRL
jgi:hypothetical protein